LCQMAVDYPLRMVKLCLRLSSLRQRREGAGVAERCGRGDGLRRPESLDHDRRRLNRLSFGNALILKARWGTIHLLFWGGLAPTFFI